MVKEKINNLKKEACYAAAKMGVMTSSLAMMAGQGTSVNAADKEGKGLSLTPVQIVDSDPTTIVGRVLAIIMMVASFIGGALLLWGLVMFALAVKNDEPESKQKALMCTFSGIILLSLRAILTAANIIG